MMGVLGLFGFLFRSSLKLVVLFFIIAAVCTFAPIIDFEPKSFKIPLPAFVGPLEPNYLLSQAEHLFEGQLHGPESIAVWNDELYTGIVGGRILKIDRNGKLSTLLQLGEPKCHGAWDMEKCARALGMKFDSKGNLYVIDAYGGLHMIQVGDGSLKVTKLVDWETKVDGQKMLFLDDLAIVERTPTDEVPNPHPVIFMTDASRKWDLKECFNIVSEHESSGRVIKFDMATKKLSTILDGLSFPNGIEATDDRTALLISDLNTRRILKYYIRGPKTGRTEVFAFQLPGEPDNIRRSARKEETYWVALALGRNSSRPALLDRLSDKPLIRKSFGKLVYGMGHLLDLAGMYLGDIVFLRDLGYQLKSGTLVLKYLPRYGMAVEIDSKGRLINSLHSPDYRTAVLSEVREVPQKNPNERVLYLGSVFNNYLGKLVVNDV